MEADTTDDIMAATYCALCEHGYANLTMQRIADESSMTSAAIHYHYDTKEGLLDAFLEHMVERFESEMVPAADDPRELLSALLDAIFTPPADGEDFAVALMELKAQAPHQPTYRERFRELDEQVRGVVADAVRDGIAAGHFDDDADPEAVAHFVATAIDGGHARGVTLGEDRVETRRMVESVLARQLGWAPEATE